MKKTGYTLAEALIAMSIVGILAAIMITTMDKIKFDKNKVSFLKTFDSVAELLSSVSGNSDYFSPLYENWDCSTAPLYNLASVTVNDKEYSESSAKICEILADGLNVKTTNICSKANDLTYYNNSSNKPLFTTPSGIDFYMYVNPTFKEETSGSTKYLKGFGGEMRLDENGEKGPNCIYDATNCKAPDQFRVIIGASGHIKAADPMAQKYIATRINLKKDSTSTGTMPANIASNVDSYSFCTSETANGGTSDGTTNTEEWELARAEILDLDYFAYLLLPTKCKVENNREYCKKDSYKEYRLTYMGSDDTKLVLAQKNIDACYNYEYSYDKFTTCLLNEVIDKYFGVVHMYYKPVENEIYQIDWTRIY